MSTAELPLIVLFFLAVELLAICFTSSKIRRESNASLEKLISELAEVRKLLEAKAGKT